VKRVLALLGISTMAVVGFVAPVAADPISAGSASAYGTPVPLGGSEAVPPTPLVEISLPPGGEAEDTTIDVPAGPVLVSGTLHAAAIAHPTSDVESQLTVVEQEVDGPYNVAATSLVEGLDVLLDAAGEGVSLVSASVIRAEAVAVCRAGAVEYSANSEIVDLDVGGNDIPLNAPVTELIDAITEVLDTTGLNAVVDVERNRVTELDGGGVAVDALVVSIAGDAVANVVIGHAEVASATCGNPPECSDTVDNADAEDTLADADDPGCHTDGNAGNPDSYDPNDDDETDAAGPPECSDGVDNGDAEDTLADAADPGCHSDGNAGNPASYVPSDDSESDAAPAPAGALPRTGGAGDVAVPAATVLGALAVGLQLLRRRALA